MLKRNKIEKIGLSPVDLEIFIVQLFEKCKNEHEVELLQKQLLSGNLVLRDVNLIND